MSAKLGTAARPLDTFAPGETIALPVTVTRRLWESAAHHDYRLTAAQSVDRRDKIMVNDPDGAGTILVTVAGVVA